MAKTPKEKVPSDKASHVKNSWTAEEDALLIKHVEDMKPKNSESISWTEIAKLIYKRTSKQCRERWAYNLDPNVDKSDFTELEEFIVLRVQLHVGNKWAIISEYLPGRTENAVKARYKSLMRSQLRIWTPNEDKFLINCYKKFGRNWPVISSFFLYRSENAVRTRIKALNYGKEIKAKVNEKVAKNIWNNLGKYKDESIYALLSPDEAKRLRAKGDLDKIKILVDTDNHLIWKEGDVKPVIERFKNIYPEDKSKENLNKLLEAEKNLTELERKRKVSQEISNNPINQNMMDNQDISPFVYPFAGFNPALLNHYSTDDEIAKDKTIFDTQMAGLLQEVRNILLSSQLPSQRISESFQLINALSNVAQIGSIEGANAMKIFKDTKRRRIN